MHAAPSVPHESRPQSGFSLGEGLMEDLPELFLDTFGYLFPAHACALPHGHWGLAVSWTMDGDSHAAYLYATPITVRFEPQLVMALQRASHEGRRRILGRHDGTLRAGMLGYDPYARVPQSRVIVLG